MGNSNQAPARLGAPEFFYDSAGVRANVSRVSYALSAHVKFESGLFPQWGVALAVITAGITFAWAYHAYAHLSHFSNPKIQRLFLRISVLAPLSSCLGLVFLWLPIYGYWIEIIAALCVEYQ